MKGNKHQTLIKLAGAYAVQRSSIVARLTSATAIGGENAQDLIDKAKQAMFGAELEAIHDIAIYGLQMFFWATHADSTKQEIVDNAIDDYLCTKDSDINSLLSGSSRGRYLNIDDDLSARAGWCLAGPCSWNEMP